MGSDATSPVSYSTILEVRLSGYLKRLYEVPAVAPTADFDHIKRTYYSIRKVNPTRIVPAGPERIFAS